MIKRLLTLIILMNFLSSFGQIADNSCKRDESNIYNQAIIQYFKYLNTVDFQISGTIYFFEDEFGLTDSLMERINDTRILRLKQSEIEELVTKKNGITIYKLFPLEYQNMEFHVTLVPYGATFRKGETGLFFSTYGGYCINFKFDKGKFKFLRIDNNSM